MLHEGFKRGHLEVSDLQQQIDDGATAKLSAE